MAGATTAQVDPEAFRKQQQQMREEFERQRDGMRKQYDDERKKAEAEFAAFRHKTFLCPAYQHLFAHIEKRIKENEMV